MSMSNEDAREIVYMRLNTANMNCDGSGVHIKYTFMYVSKMMKDRTSKHFAINNTFQLVV